MPTRYGERYTIEYSFAALRIDQQNGNGVITHVAEGATIQIDGPVDRSGMVAVNWQSERYRVFEKDILEKCSRVAAAAS